MVHDSEPISCPWPRPAVDWTDLPALQYAAAYLWFVIASALDLIVTGLILHVGGAELNGLANMILATGGMAAMIVYKFCLVVLIVIVNEQIGRLRYGTGWRMAQAAIAITLLPVFLGVMQLLIFRPSLLWRSKTTDSIHLCSSV